VAGEQYGVVAYWAGASVSYMRQAWNPPRMPGSTRHVYSGSVLLFTPQFDASDGPCRQHYLKANSEYEISRGGVGDLVRTRGARVI